MGALTSRSYAFGCYRSWELESFVTIDFLDSFCMDIQVGIRNSHITNICSLSSTIISQKKDVVTRGLMKIISNRIRFFYEGFREDRFENPFINLNGVHVAVNWSTVMLFIKLFLSFGSIRFDLLMDNSCDFYDQMCIKDFTDLIPSCSVYRECAFSVTDFVNFYTFNLNKFYSFLNSYNSKRSDYWGFISDVDKFSVNTGFFLVFIDCNLRLIMPRAFVDFKLFFEKGLVNIMSFGAGVGNWYDYSFHTFCRSLNSFLDFFFGKSNICKNFLIAKSIFVVLGLLPPRRFNFESIFRLLIYCFEKLLLIFFDCVFEFSLLPVFSNQVCTYDLGLKTQASDQLYNNISGRRYSSFFKVDKLDTILYVYNTDKMFNISCDYTGLKILHSCRLSVAGGSGGFFDIVLPALTPFEKNQSLYVRFDGKYRCMNNILIYHEGRSIEFVLYCLKTFITGGEFILFLAQNFYYFVRFQMYYSHNLIYKLRNFGVFVQFRNSFILSRFDCILYGNFLIQSLVPNFVWIQFFNYSYSLNYHNYYNYDLIAKFSNSFFSSNKIYNEVYQNFL